MQAIIDATAYGLGGVKCQNIAEMFTLKRDVAMTQQWLWGISLAKSWPSIEWDLGRYRRAGVKVLLHHVPHEARRQVICLKEDALAFTPQAISHVVTHV